MLRERCANAHSGKLTPKRHLRNLRLLVIVFFFLKKILMRAVVARSIKNVGNQQFFSVKAVFAFLFLGFGRLSCLPRNGQEELRQNSIKVCLSLLLQKALLQLLIKQLLFLRHFR